MGALSKRELSETISNRLGFSNRASLEVVNELFGLIKTTLLNDEEVKVVRFGTWLPVRKAARRGTSPTNGEPIVIPPRRTVSFRPSRVLKAILNGEQGEEIPADR